MSVDHLFLFPDTNTLLHYPPITQVDWLKVCNAKQVTLVFCMQVIHELDKKKSDGLLRSRANRAINDIESLDSEGNIVRKDVSLEIFNEELRSNEFAGDLSPDSGDDRIVHLVKRYVEKSGMQDVAVYTEDYGMRLRCKAHSIQVIRPDETGRLPDLQTELEKQYRAITIERDALKHQSPKIRIRVSDPDEQDMDSPFIIELDRNVEQLDPDQAVEEEKSRLLAEYEASVGALKPPARTSLNLDLFNIRIAPGREQYLKDVEEYLKKFRGYVNDHNEYKLSLARCFAFKVHIINNGRCPAHDVDIHLHFPSILGFLASGEEIRGKVIAEPGAPQRPKPRLNSLSWLPVHLPVSASSPFSRALNRMPTITPRWMPQLDIGGKKQTGFTVRIHIPKLNHHHTESFGSFFTMFDAWEHVNSFQVKKTITAGNIQDKDEKEIPFKVKVAESTQ